MRWRCTSARCEAGNGLRLALASLTPVIPWATATPATCAGVHLRRTSRWRWRRWPTVVWCGAGAGRRRRGADRTGDETGLAATLRFEVQVECHWPVRPTSGCRTNWRRASCRRVREIADRRSNSNGVVNTALLNGSETVPDFHFSCSGRVSAVSSRHEMEVQKPAEARRHRVWQCRSLPLSVEQLHH